MRKLAKYLKNYRKQCIFGPIFKFLEAILELLLPTIMALIINNGIAAHDTAGVLKLGALMMGLAVAGYGCAMICQYSASVASQGFGTELRNAAFSRILGFSYTEMDSFKTATLTTRITNDVNQLQQFVAMMIRLFPRAPFLCVGAIIMSFFLDVQLALILLASMPVLGAIIFFVTRAAAPHYRTYQGRLDRIARLLRENLSGVRVIRAFSKKQREAGRFYEANDGLTDTGLVIGKISAVFNPLTALTVNLTIVLILWVGGIQIDTGRLSQGEIIAFINYVNQILYALLVISNLIILFTKAMASAGRVREVLEAPVERTVPADGEEAPAESTDDAPAVEFRGVTFGYNKTGERALEDISFSLHRGETLGIIGATGSGKTTLVNLIPHFYDPDEGTVLINGQNAATLSPDALRARIGLVPQKALLFSGTVAENIRFGNPGAAADDIVRAAKTAQAQEFIEQLPEGYDTPVQRGGTNLSGGQRQRLTIARALAVDPEILILDDASSALDFLTDARLRAAIRESGPDRAVILVSQRAGVVKNADRVLVLENGRVAGLGPHDTLIRTCTVYRQICLSQLSEKEAGL